MKPSNSDEPEYPFGDALLDDEYSHVFVEYDQDSMPLSRMIETIEITGARIVNTVIVRDEPKWKKAVLFKLDSQDVRDIILNLSKYPLIRIKGYNARTMPPRSGCT